jgi:hypothetical protein
MLLFHSVTQKSHDELMSKDEINPKTPPHYAPPMKTIQITFPSKKKDAAILASCLQK